MNITTTTNTPVKEDIQYFKLHSTLFSCPKLRKLSTEAKVLYSMMRSRWFLSAKNGWKDEERVYIIFTVEEITRQLNCGSAKAIRILNELDTKKGIGLIERVNRGLGKPSKIFVKDFDGKDITNSDSVYKNDNPEAEPDSKTKTADCQNDNSVVSKNEIQEFSNEKSNNKENNNIYKNNIDISQSYHRVNGKDKNENKSESTTDMTEKRIMYCEILKSNINFNALKKQCGEIWLNQIVELMLGVVCSAKESITIGGEEHSMEVVKERFWSLDETHIEYVYHKINQVQSDVKNMRAYLLTALYRSVETADSWMRAKVRNELKNLKYALK